MPKYINKQTFEFEVQFLVEADDLWGAQDEPLSGLNIISISSLNTDRPWDSEKIEDESEVPQVSQDSRHKMTMSMDVIQKLIDQASEIK